MNIEECFQSAAQLHQAGRLGEAEGLYRQILAQDPQCADVLHMLGLLRLQMRDAAGAEALARQAISADGQMPEFHIGLGEILDATGRTDEAIAEYRCAAELDGEFPLSFAKLGAALMAKGDFAGAADALGRAAELQPELAERHYNLGAVLSKLKRHAEAEAAFEKSLNLRANFAEAMFGLSAALEARGKTIEAIELLRKALAIRSDWPEAMVQLGTLLSQSEDVDDAMQLYHRALAIRPDFGLAHYNLAVGLAAKNEFDAAIQSFQRALDFQADLAEARLGLGKAYEEQGNFAQAMAAYRTALELRPDLPGAVWNLALLQLASGDFENGWKGFESRWKIAEFHKAWLECPQPVWDGGEISGRRILIWAEDGFGDTIQFSRFIPVLAERGTKVIFRCPPQLVRLMRKLDGAESVISNHDPLPDFDVHCPMLSLALKLKINLANIPAKIPYLSAEPQLIEKWESRLAKDDRLQVGFVWANQAIPKNRCPTLAEWSPLENVSQVRWISLQKGARVPTGRQPPAGFEILDWTDELTDFAETAGLIANLDLVICVDTAVAHLAGAMGKPVWLLLKHSPEWRWMLGRADSPWYPTMRTFRQPKPRDWNSALREIRQALEAMKG